MGGGGFLEVGDGLDGDGRGGHDGEELRELGLHLGDVAGEVVDDRLLGGGDVLGVGLDVVAEGRQVLVAVRFGERGHFADDAVVLGEADAVDFVPGAGWWW